MRDPPLAIEWFLSSLVMRMRGPGCIGLQGKAGGPQASYGPSPSRAAVSIVAFNTLTRVCAMTLMVAFFLQ